MEISPETFQAYSYDLSDMINEAINSPYDLNFLIEYIRSLFNYESWGSIVNKFKTEEYINASWFEQGVLIHIKKDQYPFIDKI